EAHCVGLLKDPSTLRRLRFGSSGGKVKTLQEALTKSGHYKGTVDSDMGAGTVKALVDWQHAQNPSKPTADGIFSPTPSATIGVTFALEEAESFEGLLVGALDDKSNTDTINCPIVNVHLRGKNVALRWNRLPGEKDLIDRVVHIHGFQSEGEKFPVEE